MSQTLPKVTLQKDRSNYRGKMDFHVENGKVYSNMSSIKYINVDTKLYHTSQKLGFVTIQRQDPLSCEVTNVTGRYMDAVLDLDRG